jgi:heat shock protein HtpX
MAAMTALVGGFGLMLGGETGFIIALVFAFGMNFFATGARTSLFLRMHGARPVDARSAPDVWRMT